MPDWLTFNPRNRSVYGTPTEEGIFHIDVHYFDDANEAALINIKLTVKSEPAEDRAALYVLSILSLSMLVGMTSFFVFVVGVCKEVGKNELMSKQKLREYTIKTRHDGRKEVEVHLYQPRTMRVDRPAPPVVTNRFEFELGGDEEMFGDKTLVGEV